MSLRKHKPGGAAKQQIKHVAKSKLEKVNGKIAEEVVGGYKKIEEGETVEETKARLSAEQKAREEASAAEREKRSQKQNETVKENIWNVFKPGVIMGVIGIVGALLVGVGMCLTMVWSHMIVGIIIGIVGIVVLLCLIPFIKGLK